MNAVQPNTEIKFIEPDYEGISKVLAQFVELYKVCENKELIDRCMGYILFPPIICNSHSTELKNK